MRGYVDLYAQLRKLNITKELPQTACVFTHRPNLKNAIWNIVTAIESGGTISDEFVHFEKYFSFFI